MRGYYKKLIWGTDSNTDRNTLIQKIWLNLQAGEDVYQTDRRKSVVRNDEAGIQRSGADEN